MNENMERGASEQDSEKSKKIKELYNNLQGLSEQFDVLLEGKENSTIPQRNQLAGKYAAFNRELKTLLGQWPKKDEEEGAEK